MDDRDDLEDDQQAATAHHAYSIYEPHYQQMHPLIYYEDPSQHHHHHTQILAPVSHHWDQEHFVHMPMIPYGDTSDQACTAQTSSEPKQEPDRVGHDAEEEIGTSKIADELEPRGNNSESDVEKKKVDESANQRRGSDSPVPTNRELHNEIERRRRLRIKQCCEILRALVPGLNEKTDKATVLEATVRFINHLVGCPGYKCNCEF